MKAKYTIINGSKNKEIRIRKNGRSYIAIYEGKEYRPLSNGTSVKFNGSNRVVDQRVIVFDINGLIVMTYFNGNAAPELTCGDGSKVKCNKLANNFAMSFPLFIGLLVAIAAIIIIFIVLGI